MYFQIANLKIPQTIRSLNSQGNLLFVAVYPHCLSVANTLVPLKTNYLRLFTLEWELFTVIENATGRKTR